MEEDRVTPSALIHQYDRPAKDSRLPQQIGASLPSLAMLYTHTPLSTWTGHWDTAQAADRSC